MGYDRNAPWMTCGERDDQCAALGIDDPFSEIERLCEAIVMAENRLEAAMLGTDVCRHCVELARSYLKEAIPTPGVTNGR
jgi:hypothetical protein